MEATEYDIKLSDRYRDSMKSYWSSLLVVNGLLLTFFSIEMVTNNSCGINFGHILIASSIISIWLLLWNYRTIKKHDFELGAMSREDFPPIPEEEEGLDLPVEKIEELIDKAMEKKRKEDIDKAKFRNKIILNFEKLVEYLLVFETILILIIIFEDYFW